MILMNSEHDLADDNGDDDAHAAALAPATVIGGGVCAGNDHGNDIVGIDCMDEHNDNW